LAIEQAEIRIAKAAATAKRTLVLFFVMQMFLINSLRFVDRSDA